MSVRIKGAKTNYNYCNLSDLIVGGRRGGQASPNGWEQNKMITFCTMWVEVGRIQFTRLGANLMESLLEGVKCGRGEASHPGQEEGIH